MQLWLMLLCTLIVCVFLAAIPLILIDINEHIARTEHQEMLDALWEDDEDLAVSA